MLVDAGVRAMEGAKIGSTSKKIVSIVDDEVDITATFQDTLINRMEGTSLVSFNDPTIALDHYEKNIPDYALVIADFRMPNMDGMEFLKRVKKLNPKVRTLLMSAFEFRSNPIFEKYHREGIIDSYMDKPMTVDGLCQRVTEEFRIYQLTSNELIK